jgi:hypothetical protein
MENSEKPLNDYTVLLGRSPLIGKRREYPMRITPEQLELGKSGTPLKDAAPHLAEWEIVFSRPATARRTTSNYGSKVKKGTYESARFRESGISKIFSGSHL